MAAVDLRMPREPVKSFSSLICPGTRQPIHSLLPFILTHSKQNTERHDTSMVECLLASAAGPYHWNGLFPGTSSLLQSPRGSCEGIAYDAQEQLLAVSYRESVSQHHSGCACHLVSRCGDVLKSRREHTPLTFQVSSRKTLIRGKLAHLHTKERHEFYLTNSFI